MILFSGINLGLSVGQVALAQTEVSPQIKLMAMQFSVNVRVCQRI